MKQSEPKMRSVLRNLISLVLLTLPFVAVSCQKTEEGPKVNWEKTYGGPNYDVGYSVQQTSDGGYIVAGYTSSFGAGGQDIYLIKTDNLGDTIWTKTYGGTNSDFGYSVQQTSDGGYVIVGFTYCFGSGNLPNIYFIRTNTSGDTLWTKTYNGKEGYSVQQTSDGGYIIAGTSDLALSDVYLIKTDANGDLIWAKTYGGTNPEHGAVQQTSDGGYIVVGGTSDGNDIWLLKTDVNGDTLWSHTYGGDGADYGKSVQQTSDGGYIIAGSTHSFSKGDADVYLIKTDAVGDTIWTETYGGKSDDYGRSVKETIGGGYIIAGWTYSFSSGGYPNVYLIKTDENGGVMWTEAYGGANYVYGTSAQQTSDGGYVIAGWIWFSGTGEDDVYLLKTEPDLE
jgi:hypothetical protein